MRTPDEILTDFDKAQAIITAWTGREVYNLRDLMWEVLEDLRDTVRIVASDFIGPDGVDHLSNGIDDYLCNNYGDD